jgi:UDP-3-O-[3-hydroxymyristoyl] glucosamine N-acyltransferase
VGISGSARIGRHCLIGGGAGVVGHLAIADDVVVTGMSMVTRSIRHAGVYSSGIPAQPGKDWNRHLARLRRLESLIKRIEALENDRKG